MTSEPSLWRDRFQRKLEALRKREDIPADLLDLVQRTAKLQFEAQDRLNGGLKPKAEPADKERTLQGAPLYSLEDFDHDPEAARALALDLLEMLAGMEGHLSSSSARLRNALSEGELDLEKAFAAHLKGDQDYFHKAAEMTPDAPGLVRFLAQASLLPALRVQAEAAELPEGMWIHGHCPLCGSPPLMARLVGKEGHRYLTCSMCWTEYRSKRLQCPHCLEEDQEKMTYFQAREEPGFQVHVCSTCQTYIKTSDFRALDKLSVPVLDDLESLPLDAAAAERGFMRPTASAWGF
ncbi:formate dehydrogenase accessory protein FdhE [Desulfohalovibrio reitneri]|uniref:formate dehydrogenase accessory protein FdhE n=1 Tax=Desulfohalovibrio reitneri TaxID=1307759 RepID=UPI0004A7626B|nr:formate dehydrogenase accessory protein FdhE [Desulfohalovibrio reitneri]